MKKILLIALLSFYFLVSNGQDTGIVEKSNLKALPPPPSSDTKWIKTTYNRLYYNEGNVGIGTSSPSHKLQVYSSGWKAKFSGSDGYIMIGPANSSWAHIYTDRPKFIFNKDIYSISGGFSAYSSANLYLKTNGTTRMTIDKARGDVYLNMSPNSDRGKFNIKQGWGDWIHFYHTSNSGYWAFHNGQDQETFHIYYKKPDGSIIYPLRLKADGSIETMELLVAEVKADNIKSKQLTLEIENVADYVFDEDYKLNSLEEVESFVKENKHLPGIPSAKVLEEQGVNVAEMSNLLLQKIEELTLYIIDLKKENEELKELFNQSISK